jgi:hypothetical protein
MSINITMSSSSISRPSSSTSSRMGLGMPGVEIVTARPKKRTSAGLRLCPDCGRPLRPVSIQGGGRDCEMGYQCRMGHGWTSWPSRHLLERGLPCGGTPP